MRVQIVIYYRVVRVSRDRWGSREVCSGKYRKYACSVHIICVEGRKIIICYDAVSSYNMSKTMTHSDYLCIISIVLSCFQYNFHSVVLLPV